MDKIYDDSIGGKKGNLLKTNVIEKYSVLKYFMKIKKDFLIDFVADELLNDYSKELDEAFEIQKKYFPKLSLEYLFKKENESDEDEIMIKE